MIVAGSIYRSPEACHGPCYVLDPFAYELGERIVLETIPAKNPPVKKPRKVFQKPVVTSNETRRVVVHIPGRPYEWQIVNVPVRASEPVWAVRARELRAHGWSYRKIMKETGVKNMALLHKTLNEYVT